MPRLRGCAGGASVSLQESRAVVPLHRNRACAYRPVDHDVTRRGRTEVRRATDGVRGDRRDCVAHECAPLGKSWCFSSLGDPGAVVKRGIGVWKNVRCSVGRSERKSNESCEFTRIGPRQLESPWNDSR